MDGNRSHLVEPETVEIVTKPPDAGSAWAPIVGGETYALLDALVLPENIRSAVLEEAAHILSHCVPPQSHEGPRVGLVVGHIQSGKTLSFTVLSALARDNAYQLVIVITGTSMPLAMQSYDRLRHDLRIDVRDDLTWVHLHCPRGPTDCQTVRDALQDWHDPILRKYGSPPTILITVMKNHHHLAKLADALSQMDLSDVPTIVIDDEADQAGLNTRANQGEQSTTYQRLLRLRQCLPYHTFLQYTATPQAPLLIALIDALSPRFATVLTPGPDYVGGDTFFRDHRQLVRTIPLLELPDADVPLHEPPRSMCEAMRVYFLGVAAGWVAGRRGKRSMLIHPSRETALHREFYHVVSQVRGNWQRILDQPPDDPDRQEIIEEFRVAYEDLAATVEDPPPFEELAECLASAIRGTRVWEMNAASGRTPEIDWRSAYSHILVGGQALDRGFTVEGLTVTYMPRGVGVGNADTVQQRARFLGYKREYLGYCRVYLEQNLRDAYTEYVEHEETLRHQLAEYAQTGRPLCEWRRAFFLTPRLRPTRGAVLTLDYYRGRFSEDWFYPRSPHCDAQAIDHNNTVVEQFIGQLSLRADPGHPERTVTQCHQVDDRFSLAAAYEQLLTSLRFGAPDDSYRLTGVLLQIDQYLSEVEDETCAVYVMGTDDGQRTRRRGLDDRDRILNLFQGAYPSTPRQKQGTIYPGDRLIRSPRGLTLQIHPLTITKGDAREIISPYVLTVAVWVPAQMAGNWLVQEEQDDAP